MRRVKAGVGACGCVVPCHSTSRRPRRRATAWESSRENAGVLAVRQKSADSLLIPTGAVGLGFTSSQQPYATKG